MILQYKQAANLFYGNRVGDTLYGFAEKLCKIAFDDAISAEIPIILTTAMSPYNQFGGWYSPKSNTIEIVRHYCKAGTSGIEPRDTSEILAVLAHELCHVYQEKILGGATGKRGPHRCRSWYDAITYASPFVCGVDIDGLCNPLRSVREGRRVTKVQSEASLSEVELTHWPDSVIRLAKNKDHRLEGRILSIPAID